MPVGYVSRPGICRAAPSLRDGLTAPAGGLWSSWARWGARACHLRLPSITVTVVSSPTQTLPKVVHTLRVVPAAACLVLASWCLADVRPKLIEAQELYASARYEQALKLFTQAAEAADAPLHVEYNIALCHLQLGDAEKAIRGFEAVASRSDAAPDLRRDAFYNIGFCRATAARGRLDALLAPATQPSERKPPADAPENMAELQSIADELLRAIVAFKSSADIEPSADTEHNMRVARILRRNVLGLLRRAEEAKQKQDILDDPQAYLEALIEEQDRQTSLARYMLLAPPAEASAARQARRAAVRLQRATLERTDTFAKHLLQFRERPVTASGPAGQAAEPTPRERLYAEVARRLEPAIQAQRDACGHYLDGEVGPARERQREALETMRTAAALFPLDPARALVRARDEQQTLIRLVLPFESRADWWRDPWLDAAITSPPAEWETRDTPLYDHQEQIGRALERLAKQCRQIAAASQPAGTREDGLPDPRLDADLNRKLAEILEQAGAPQGQCLEAITRQNKLETLTAQKRVADVIQAALDVLPKTVEQRIAELIIRQTRLNADTRAEAPDARDDERDAGWLQRLHDLTGRLRRALLPRRPAQIASSLRQRQQEIRKETSSVAEEIRKSIPAGGSAAAAAGGSGTDSGAQASIEAGKHLDKADFEMASASEGLERAVVEDSLDPLKTDGPVQPPQARALDELKKALAALRPPASQPQQDRKQEKGPSQESPQPREQDVRRAVERQDKEREEAMRQLYMRPPRTPIKDW